jgi:predicted DNA binding protein
MSTKGIQVNMRKMIVRVPNYLLDCCGQFAEIAERFEIINVFNIRPTDYTEVCRITLKEGAAINDVRNEYISEITVLAGEGKDYTFLVKGRVSEEISGFIARFDLRIDYPIVFEGDSCQFGMIGSSEELQSIVNAAKERSWGLEILSLYDYNPLVSGLMSELTGKQRDILKTAYRQGYFDHPRKIDSGKLAEKMGIHKTTLLEHLHKAEKRLVGRILDEGY